MTGKFYQLTVIFPQFVSLYKTQYGELFSHQNKKFKIVSTEARVRYTNFYNRASREQATGLNWRRTGNLIGDKRT